MEEAAELADYLTLSFKTPKEQEYIAKLVDDRNEVIQVWLRCC